ncbi:histone-lysine N-methyltransferase SETMAR-like [Ptiloglossa arizonensis]|uniref:histone-lysine N-methyltransferase SETMAR-like n=1 Tax=Ptiloglossa arizonensis TaxID=3350558 RepID=UPI003F9F54B3
MGEVKSFKPFSLDSFTEPYLTISVTVLCLVNPGVLERSKMEVKKEKIRYILQYHYDHGEKAEQAAKKICAVYGPNTVSNATAKRRFQRFHSNNMDVENETRSGRPIIENVDKIMEIVESARHASTYSITQELKIRQKTVWNHLHKASLKKKLDIWWMVIGDEEWVTYENNRFYCVFGGIGSEFSTISCSHRTNHSTRTYTVRCYVPSSNARPHTSLTTRQKLRELEWQVISHPPYSPDLAPSYYHLFKHLSNFLGGKRLGSREACENELVKFFTDRDEDFFNRGITKLPTKWTKVIEQNGAYLI